MRPRRYPPLEYPRDMVVWEPPVRFDFDPWKAANADYETIERIQTQLNRLAGMQPGWYRYALHQMSLLPASAYRTRQAYSIWERYIYRAWERAVEQSPDAAVLHALGAFIWHVKTRAQREKQERRAARKAEAAAKKARAMASLFGKTDAAMDAVFAIVADIDQQDKRRGSMVCDVRLQYEAMTQEQNEGQQ